ncbi:simple sugar transport system ATP-binding protein [Hydrogenispora ethanolica]|uniref:Simple sugar transport system ATP-binding protein n=1 Tax=Hydrogenispora ethanolica TaxID=1082276 RepID=A0A4R1S279_HYDET|nr:sugar ABC transporter ATP-binding protein [Hydrogenispora ethanolica]TCL73285.1 simple sugar transport system ATP-binding protein [Hydrogenispora ethanolica]
MTEPLLTVRNVSKSFSGVQALKSVNLTIQRGEIRCLAGENGSGKSTLIKVISGVNAPDEGEIELNGKVFKRLHPIEAIREGIQIIYQDFSLFPNLTVAENIALNLEVSRNQQLVNWREVSRVAEEALRRIEVRIDLDAKVEDLSVADKQLVAISRALLQNAKLIIMDEPTTALTQKEVRSLFTIIKGLQQQGIAILFVSHKLEEVYEIAEKITILRNGAKVLDADMVELDRPKFVYYMTGRQIEDSPFHYDAAKVQDGPLLKVDRLSRRGEYRDISFALYPGEILGVTGLLGSGRTELAMTLFGLRPADCGEIAIAGETVRLESVQDAIRHRIAYVPEDRLTEGLFLEQSIGKNIIISTIEKYLNRCKLLDSGKLRAEIAQWVKGLSIVTPSAEVPVQSLSGGNQQRVVLAKWLAAQPQILILNGPTVGVDIGSKSDIHQIVRELARQGMGVIIISDDIPELIYNCNRILLMRQGGIAAEFHSGEITEAELAQKLSGAA